MPASRTEVLIAGAGPTGLVLALWLTRLGVRLRIVDKAAEPGTTSRALAVQARTLELYDQMDLAAAVVEAAVRVPAVNLWAGGKRAARAEFSEIGAGLTPYPGLLIYPQDEHERLLIARLEAVGVTVERPCELTGFTNRGDRVEAQLRRADGSLETCEALWLAGCDGAHSVVRHGLGIGFEGAAYQHLFYVADVQATGEAVNGEIDVALDDSDFVVLFPMKGQGRVRLIGTMRIDDPQRAADLGWDDVSTRAIERLKLQVQRVNWFSTYHVHHRVADRFRQGRAFLLGDAAHIHSPVGGQGMNTGIGDAINLAWKLAMVVRGRAPDALLDSYGAERVPFARRLVATTDRAFSLVTADGPVAARIRVDVAPRLLGALFRQAAVRRFMFRTVSQTGVNYRSSALSVGGAGMARGGDRLPWVASADNYAPLKAMAWQVHVHGEATAALGEACQAQRLPLHRFVWSPAAGKAGLMRDAAYLIRPDGYIALADPHAAPENLEAYFTRRGLDTAPTASKR